MLNHSSAGSTHRVWQTLPRHLRRRAASHDVRRVPLRLRDRARAEVWTTVIDSLLCISLFLCRWMWYGKLHPNDLFQRQAKIRGSVVRSLSSNDNVSPTILLNAWSTSFTRGSGKILWLETHIWHAKRMHMENLWGYRLVC